MTKTRVRFDSDTNFSNFLDELGDAYGGMVVDHNRLSVVFYDLTDAIRKSAEDNGGRFEPVVAVERRATF